MYISTCLNKILIKILQAGKSIAFTLGFFNHLQALPDLLPFSSQLNKVNHNDADILGGFNPSEKYARQMGSFRQG